MASEMVTEKSTKMRETLKILGLNPTVYAFSHVFTRALCIAGMSLVSASLILACDQTTSIGQAVQNFLSFSLSNIATLCLMQIYTNFFWDPKLVTICIWLLLFLPSGLAMISILGPIQAGEVNNWVQYLFWLPNFPFITIVCSTYEPDNTYFTVPVWVAWACLVLQIPAYFSLHLWLENVMPNEFGVRKTCFYCCQKSKTIDIEQEPAEDQF
jgi:hypothetical protein